MSPILYVYRLIGKICRHPFAIFRPWECLCFLSYMLSSCVEGSCAACVLCVRYCPRPPTKGGQTSRSLKQTDRILLMTAREPPANIFFVIRGQFIGAISAWLMSYRRVSGFKHCSPFMLSVWTEVSSRTSDAPPIVGGGGLAKWTDWRGICLRSACHCRGAQTSLTHSEILPHEHKSLLLD